MSKQQSAHAFVLIAHRELKANPRLTQQHERACEPPIYCIQYRGRGGRALCYPLPLAQSPCNLLQVAMGEGSV